MRQRLSHRKSARGQITLTPGGFEVWEGGERSAKICWNELEQVVAFKRDAITFDIVCLEVRTTVGGVRELDDEFEGFWEFVGELKRAVPGSRQDWERVVLQPAFLENRTVLLGQAE